MRTNQAAAERFAAFAVACRREGTPKHVRRSARDRTLDILGLAAAALELETSATALGFVERQGGPGEATVVGLADRAPAAWAAFANGVLAHSLDYDDTHLPSVLHPSASVIPAALAAAEYADASGEVMLDAAAVGIETVVRLGMAGFDPAAGTSLFFEHGQHATSICGSVGAAVAAAVCLDLAEGSVSHAIGIAASMAGGVLEGNRQGGTVKRLHCGWAAHAGVTAALLAQAGITGPPTALEGRFGFFRAFLHDEIDVEELCRALGTEWSVPGIFFKPYPANHFTHTGFDAATRLRERGLRPEQVESAVLGVAGPTVRTIGEPLDLKQHPPTGYAAQFSGPFLVALGLLGDAPQGATLAHFTDERARDHAMRDLMARITVASHPDCDATFPHQFPSVLTVRTKAGEVIEERVMVNRGGPDNPLTAEDLRQKYELNALRVFAPNEVDAVATALLASPTSSPATLLAPFRRAP